MLKQLEPVGLTDDQVAKIKSIGTAAQEAMQAAGKEAGITPELKKKLAEAQKSMKDSELKGKERMAALHKAAGLSEAQAAAMAKVNELRTKMNKDVYAVLTDTQKENLPEKLKRLAGPAKRGAAKKGDARRCGTRRRRRTPPKSFAWLSVDDSNRKLQLSRAKAFSRHRFCRPMLNRWGIRGRR